MYELISLISFILQVLNLIIILQVLLSWFISNPMNPIMHILNGITRPILEPIRRILPTFGGFDFSPIVAIFLINIIRRIIIQF